MNSATIRARADAPPAADGGAAGGAALRERGFVDEAMPWLDAVYRFALRLTGGDGDEAEDLVQETFLRAYRHWHTYSPGTSARAWLFTICRNAFLRARERQARRPETPASRIDADTEAVAAAALFHEIGEADPERALFRSLVGHEVGAAIARLPDEFREAVALGDIEGLPYAEIAAVLGVPLGTVKSRLFRGRRLLALALRDHARDMGFLPAGAP